MQLKQPVGQHVRNADAQLLGHRFGLHGASSSASSPYRAFSQRQLQYLKTEVGTVDHACGCMYNKYNISGTILHVYMCGVRSLSMVNQQGPAEPDATAWTTYGLF